LLGGGSSARPILEVEIRKLLPGAVCHDDSDKPKRREAAVTHNDLSDPTRGQGAVNARETDAGVRFFDQLIYINTKSQNP